jgi:hypothetical protein
MASSPEPTQFKFMQIAAAESIESPRTKSALSCQLNSKVLVDIKLVSERLARLQRREEAASAASRHRG